MIFSTVDAFERGQGFKDLRGQVTPWKQWLDKHLNVWFMERNPNIIHQ